jgi:putative endonuclease
MHDLQVLGNCGERAVVSFLQRQGYEVLACNVRWRGGEIDIIARYQDTLAFVEVKTRRQDSRFPLSSVVTSSKQHKIITTARQFVARNKLHNYALRFDISLVLLLPGKEPAISYISNAFTAPDSCI